MLLIGVLVEDRHGGVLAMVPMSNVLTLIVPYLLLDMAILGVVLYMFLPVLITKEVQVIKEAVVILHTADRLMLVGKYVIQLKFSQLIILVTLQEAMEMHIMSG